MQQGFSPSVQRTLQVTDRGWLGAEEDARCKPIRRGWTEATMGARTKGDVGKLKIAAPSIQKAAVRKNGPVYNLFDFDTIGGRNANCPV